MLDRMPNRAGLETNVYCYWGADTRLLVKKILPFDREIPFSRTDTFND